MVFVILMPFRAYQYALSLIAKMQLNRYKKESLKPELNTGIVS